MWTKLRLLLIILFTIMLCVNVGEILQRPTYWTAVWIAIYIVAILFNVITVWRRVV